MIFTFRLLKFFQFEINVALQAVAVRKAGRNLRHLMVTGERLFIVLFALVNISTLDQRIYIRGIDFDSLKIIIQGSFRLALGLGHHPQCVVGSSISGLASKHSPVNPFSFRIVA